MPGNTISPSQLCGGTLLSFYGDLYPISKNNVPPPCVYQSYNITSNNIKLRIQLFLNFMMHYNLGQLHKDVSGTINDCDHVNKFGHSYFQEIA